MTDPYSNMVREFHESFGLKVRDTPEVGTPDERVLRVRLMLEEVLEFAKAAGVQIRAKIDPYADGPIWVESLEDLGIAPEPGADPDLVKMAHELADAQYVTSGTAVQFGIPLLPVTAEVHGANMRKLGPDGKPIMDELGKVRKPDGWRPADVGVVLKRLNEGEE